MKPSVQPTPERPSPAATLRAVHVGLREDLEVSRHLFRGEPCYIVRDPMTFQGQRLSLPDYAILVGIQAERALGETFHDLVLRGMLSDHDEDRFYQFVMSLHRLGFLRLPITDDKLLYRRYQLRQRTQRHERWMSFLFLRIPLWNPDAFLNRTIHLARPLFGRTFFVAWVMLMGFASYVAGAHWQELVQPLHGMLVAQNILLLWITLIVLKVFHEMGHAYACKHYGGHVPELGVYLILFTPCAYMDATASWGFSRKRERFIVCLAGMYVESIIAAAAVLVWASTEPSMVHAVAYNLIFLAGVVTVLFNINPLMRYDGYYLLSDLVEIPNLRQRSNQYVLGVLKRGLLGLTTADGTRGWRERGILFVYAVAATIYRIGLLLTLAAVLASKMFVVGATLGAGYLAMILLTNVRKMIRYLWHAEETAPRRWRAAAVGITVLLLIPASVFWVPVPSHVHAAALLGREKETIVRATSAGFLERAAVQDGQHVAAGDVLVELSNDSAHEEVARTEAALRASEMRRDALRVRSAARAVKEEVEATAYEAAVEWSRTKLAELQVRAPQTGRIVHCLRDWDLGMYLAQGSPVAAIVSGRWEVRSILTEEQIVRSKACVGDLAEFRAVAMPSQIIEGRITKIAPVGSRTVELRPLTHLGGGDIAVDPATHDASQPYFEVTLELLNADSLDLRHGMTGRVRLHAVAEPIGKGLGRRLTRFWNRLLEG